MYKKFFGNKPILKNKWEIEILRKANIIVMEILLSFKERVRPGISTFEFEELALELCEKKGVKPAFKGYRGYPYAVCVSVNEVIVHGMPKKEKILKEGDIVSFDFGVVYEGYVGDAALTVGVGEISDKAKKLLKVTEEALYKGIEKAHFGNRIGDISYAIQKHVESNGFNVIREFVGHGVGRQLHEPPEVPNFGKPGKGPKIEIGMVLAIEPMVSAGSPEVEILEDGWTAVTKDRSLAAHFEHSVAITPQGPEILSRI
ncbi:methionine aminopeptidase, type I [Thermodesulfobacterium geofontis OPF15]|uniref:Methionine aminopeptidase n=1 Tax=Thermodesulfobacterium geofontis (strain OPF15) TaxID=795359 RepID=F8C5A5_THEGP|nr:type I methionyl aminopeptidase [Thermodesulfobacterium geofontis]AEH22876.1 methionine aminopeptidase, type I [Thermodesulfobacterium geofontis OPF15]